LLTTIFGSDSSRRGSKTLIKPCRERLGKAVLDASVLMLIYDGVAIFEEIENVLGSIPKCVVPKQVLDELEKIARRGQPKKRRAALLALDVIKRNCSIVEPSGATGDDAIIDYVASDCDAIPVTADRELRRRLRERGIPHIYYRAEKKGLELEG